MAWLLRVVPAETIDVTFLDERVRVVRALWWLPLCGVLVAGDGRSGIEVPPGLEVARFTAVGFGTAAESWATPGQNQLLAIRSARLDAYRAMAEQVYGFRLSGSTRMAAMMVADDRLRIHVDALIRGASVVSVREIGPDVYEVVLEMVMILPSETEFPQAETVVVPVTRESAPLDLLKDWVGLG